MIDFESTAINVRGLWFSALAAGPIDRKLVVLLHGFPEFADARCDVMRRVAEAGFYTVAVGRRGYSARARPTGVSD